MYHCIILYHALISYSFVEPVGRKWNRSASLSSSWGPRLGRTCFRVRLGTSLGFETLLILRGEDDLKIQVPGTQTCIGVSRYLHLCSPMCFMLWTQSGEDQMNFLVQKRLPSSKITPKGLQKKMITVDVISDLCHKLPGPGWHDAATRAKTRLSEKVGQAVMTLSPSKGIQNPKPRLAVFKLPWRESKMAGPSPNLQHHTLSPKLQRLTDASSKVLHGKKAMTALKKLKLLRIRNLPKDRSRSRVAGATVGTTPHHKFSVQREGEETRPISPNTFYNFIQFPHAMHILFIGTGSLTTTSL